MILNNNIPKVMKCDWRASNEMLNITVQEHNKQEFLYLGCKMRAFIQKRNLLVLIIDLEIRKKFSEIFL